MALEVARALDVDVGRLFSDEAAEEKITVDRAHDRAGAEGGRYRALASALLGKSMSPFVVRPTDKLTDDAHEEHAGHEFGFVHTGSVELDFKRPDGQARRGRQCVFRRVDRPQAPAGRRRAS